MNSIKTGCGEEKIVALHGIQATNTSWLNVSEEFDDKFEIHLPNLIGRKSNEINVTSNSYSLADYAKDLHSFLDSFDKEVWLVGWSMGVSVILQYISIHGTAKIKGLVLLSGSPNVSLTHWFKGTSIESIALEARQRQLNLGLKETAHPIAVAKTWIELKKSDQTSTLPSITVPTLILHGTDDDQCPISHAHLLNEGIPNSELISFPGVGHNILKEAPSKIACKITKFINKKNKNLL